MRLAGTLLAATLTQAVMLAMRGNDAERASSIPRRADSRLRVVKRAIEFMRANLVNDIGIPEICAAAFASRRTLQYCFEEFMHTTPQAHLRALRLNEARRALKLRADFDWPRPDKRREFLRVRRNEAGGLDLFPNQSSGVLTSAVWGDGVVDNPSGQAIAKGDLVDFLSFAELLA